MAIARAAAHLHPAIISRFGAAVVDLEIWRALAADARPCLGIDARKTRSSYQQLISHPHLNPLPNKEEAEGCQRGEK
jgi:hypothetical protein